MTRCNILLVVLLAGPVLVQGQNLVPNPSFECGNDQCDFTVTASSVEHGGIACGWSCPTKGTSDFFSTVIPNKYCWSSMPPHPDYSGPESPVGTQMPRTGNRFAGIFTYERTYFDPVSQANESYREYLQVKLTEPLVPAVDYCGELYVSMAEWVGVASNNIGMCFYNTKIEDYSHSRFLAMTPLVVEKEAIFDGESWSRIYNHFTVDSIVEYLSIGNFYGDSETELRDHQGNPITFENVAAYYFVDDVSVSVIDKKPLISYSPVVCKGMRANAAAKETLEDIVWSLDSDTTVIIGRGPYLNFLPDSTVTYRVTARNCKFVVSDTFTIRVNPVPVADLGDDVEICEGDTVILDGGPGHAGYRWQDGASGRYYSASKGGRYAVQVMNQFGCTADADIDVVQHPLPVVNLGIDTLICNGVYFPLTVGGGYDSYEWSTGSTDSVITPQAPGRYWLRVRDRCGEAADTIAIYTLDELFIPNVLTLNSDTVNRYLEIQGRGDGSYGRLTLFNRWGKQIYSKDNYDNEWPEDAEAVPSGIYYYTFAYPGCRARKGWVQVIR